MRKILSLVLGAALLLGTLSGCSGTAGQSEGKPKLDPKNPVQLEIWHYYNGPQKTAFDKLIAEFNETVGMDQGIIVEAFSQGNVDELVDKVVAAAKNQVGAGEVPDIFAAYSDTAYEVDKLDLLADLDQYLTQEELSEYRPEFISEGRFDANGTLKIFPVAKSVELLFLNATDWNKFAEATGADWEDLATVEGVTRTAEEYYNWTDSLTPEAGDGKAFFGRDAMANYFIIGCRQLGVEIFGGSGDSAKINPDKTALRRLWDNYYIPFIRGWFAANGRFRSDDAHMGDIIALVGSSSSASYFPAEVTVTDFESYPIECAVMPAPVFAGGEAYAVQQGAGMCVTKSDPGSEYASTVFLRWFTEAERNIRFSVGSGYLPVKTGALDQALMEAALDESGAGDQRVRQSLVAALQQLSTSTMYTTSAFEGGNAARSVLEHSMSDRAAADREAVLNAVAGGTPAAEAMAPYLSDASFESWYASFVSELNNARTGA